MIEKEGSRWVVRSTVGKKLGSHRTKGEAESQWSEIRKSGRQRHRERMKRRRGK